MYSFYFNQRINTKKYKTLSYISEIICSISHGQISVEIV